MPNFWENIGNQQQTPRQQGFNIQDFFKFMQESKGQDPNQMLQQVLQSGKITQEQLDGATKQAQGIYQMLSSMGILK